MIRGFMVFFKVQIEYKFDSLLGYDLYNLIGYEFIRL